MNNPYETLATGGRRALACAGWRALQTSKHGDLQGWLDVIEKLPGPDGHAELDRGCPRLGRPGEDAARIGALLMALHPWRKGPLQMAGVKIDTEWRSDWKWDRLAPHLDLAGHEVLDIGCGNGYFGLRMLGMGARRVVGIDPTMVFVMQWLAMHKLCPGLDNYVLPLGIEDLPPDTKPFDSVFSMGVLYHRREPVRHLGRVAQLAREGGQVVLETLVLPGSGDAVLRPPGRYARMRNVHAIPSLDVLLEWLKEAGLAQVEVLDVSKTTLEEQRSTPWMRFESLSECLDPDDPSRTVEGHPAPVRAALFIRT